MLLDVRRTQALPSGWTRVVITLSNPTLLPVPIIRDLASNAASVSIPNLRPGGDYSLSVDLFNGATPVATGTKSPFALTAGANSVPVSMTITNILVGRVETLCGTPQIQDGIGARARFYSPFGMVRAGDFVYSVESTANRVRRMDLRTAEVITFAGGVFGYSNDQDGIGTNATFSLPDSITAYDGFLYVGSSYSNRIRRIDLSTREVTTIATNISAGALTAADGFLYIGASNQVLKMDLATLAITPIAGAKLVGGNVDGFGADARFQYTSRMIVLDGFLYVAAGEIRMVDLSTNEVTTLAEAEFTNARALTYHDGAFFVADNNVIRRLDFATGTVTTVAGQTLGGLKDDVGTLALFKDPCDLMISGTDLYVADTNNNRIRKVDLATTAVTTFAGGDPGFADGVGGDVEFKIPWGMAEFQGDVYIADKGNCRIRKLNIATRAVTTVAGSTPGFADGVGAEAKFLGPTGLVLHQGFLFITDYSAEGSRIRRMDLATREVTTLAGGTTLGVLDGTGPNAQFNSPLSLTAFDNALYVAETNSTKIRMVNLTNNQVTTLATTGTMEGIRFLVAGNGKLYAIDFPRRAQAHRLLQVDLTTPSLPVTVLSAYMGTCKAVAFTGPFLYYEQFGAFYKLDLATKEITKIAGAGVRYLFDGSETEGPVGGTLQIIANSDGSLTFHDGYQVRAIY